MVVRPSEGEVEIVEAGDVRKDDRAYNYFSEDTNEEEMRRKKVE